uniref:Uncharacterized protein n=1 Tax=Sus scrofa TaxID=9823 RepID=A0A8D1EZI9_PIG
MFRNADDGCGREGVRVTVTVLVREKGLRERERKPYKSRVLGCPDPPLVSLTPRAVQGTRRAAKPGVKRSFPPGRATAKTASAVCGCCPLVVLGPHGTRLSPAGQRAFSISHHCRQGISLWDSGSGRKGILSPGFLSPGFR